jgi:hypothetical protein
MGYSQVAATAIVDEQGIYSLEELGILKDEEITNLCKVRLLILTHYSTELSRPNPGISVSLCVESNTKLVK